MNILYINPKTGSKRVTTPYIWDGHPALNRKSLMIVKAAAIVDIHDAGDASSFNMVSATPEKNIVFSMPRKELIVRLPVCTVTPNRPGIFHVTLGPCCMGQVMVHVGSAIAGRQPRHACICAS